MKTLTQIALIALLVVLVPAVASASLQVNGNLTIGDSNYLGFNHDGQPASPAHEVLDINNLITLAAGAGVTDVGGQDYDRLNSTLAGPFPTAVVTDAVKDETAPFNPLVITSAYQYILAKYGGGGASDGGSLVWFFKDGITGNVTVPSSLPNSGPGLSHVSAYNKITAVIPEPGTFAVWGLLALTGYFGMKKFQAKA